MTLNLIDNLVNQILDKLPQGADVLRDDINQSLKTGLTIALKKMHLVTRDEFDIQKAVLEKTREKLEQLEKQVQALEQT
ncbi:hypothetical protein MNBD_GAMMA21-1654 [hydrothermal vent metagenome]|uniref:Ubiquinone biosynthesis accessory factor UbiK n=1 Tax=hydrothermal vent metagenome TaxID=652676 RepID=A0A3B1AMY6_9ZZZZ